MKMKKKVNRKTSSSSVHPLVISDHHHNLSVVLPEPIFSLTLSLSQQDKHVLAYLLSSSSTSNNKTNNKKTTTVEQHPPVFTCKCFSCYMSYWALWDSSPNQNLIHHIIDAFEDTTTTLLLKNNKTTKKDRKNKPNLSITATASLNEQEETELTHLNESESLVTECEEQEQEQEQGSVRKLVSFLGEKIWGVWT